VAEITEDKDLKDKKKDKKIKAKVNKNDTKEAHKVLIRAFDNRKGFLSKRQKN